MLDSFNCEMCGVCCKRKEDYIPLTLFDLIRVITKDKTDVHTQKYFFKIHMIYIGSIGDISRTKKNIYKYSINVDGWVPLPYIELPCKYIINNKCNIHLHKPLICTSFPYHLPIWKKNDSCHLIRKLHRNKEGKLFIPKKVENAIKLYPIALSASIYQLNLPIYTLDRNKNNLVLENSFRDLVDTSKNVSNIASKNQISRWVKNHSIRFILNNKQYMDMKLQLQNTLYEISQDKEEQNSYFLIMKHLAKNHFVTEKIVNQLIEYFL